MGELERRKIIEAERRRILAQDGSALKNFLPRGVMMHDDDAALVGLVLPDDFAAPASFAGGSSGSRSASVPSGPRKDRARAASGGVANALGAGGSFGMGLGRKPPHPTQAWVTTSEAGHAPASSSSSRLGGGGVPPQPGFAQPPRGNSPSASEHRFAPPARGSHGQRPSSAQHGAGGARASTPPPFAVSGTAMGGAEPARRGDRRPPSAMDNRRPPSAERASVNRRPPSAPAGSRQGRPPPPFAVSDTK